jgi:GT2 family glycosyltransferase
MVYTIIITYNGMKWIDKCIRSLSKDEIVTKILIIDNGSTDGTVEHITQEYPLVELIVNKYNYGFGYSNNQGLRIALDNNAEYAFLLNQDAWIEEGSVTKLVEIHKKNDGYGILSPMHLTGNGGALDMKFSTFVAQSENHKIISDLFLHRANLEEVYTVNFVNAAAWLIPRECLEIVGGFAPIYHHYGEDMDYSNRVRFHGYKTGICPSSLIYHDRENIIKLPDISSPREYLRLKKIWHLIYLTDINHNFLKRYMKLSLICFGKCMGSIARLRADNVWTYLLELKVLIFIFPSVLLNNSHSRKRGKTFILNH